MKKTYFKKSLSVIMAVLMVMSCWVFVAPEHNHATAAMASQEGYASEVTGYVNIDPVIYVHGTYDGTYYTGTSTTTATFRDGVDSSNSYQYDYMMNGSRVADGTVKGEYQTNVTIDGSKQLDSISVENTSNASVSLTTSEIDGKQVLTGDLGDEYNAITQTTSDKTVTLKFTFKDGTFEYHQLSVLANPVAQHVTTLADGTKSNKRRVITFMMLANGSTGTNGDLVNINNLWKNGIANFGSMYSPNSSTFDAWWENSSNSYIDSMNYDAMKFDKYAGNYAIGRDSSSKFEISSTSPTATYYYDLSSNNNVGVYYSSEYNKYCIDYTISSLYYSSRKDSGDSPIGYYTHETNNCELVKYDESLASDSVWNSYADYSGVATVGVDITSSGTYTGSFMYGGQHNNNYYAKAKITMPYQIKVVDYSALRTVYNNYVNQNLVAGAYTSSSWAKYTAALQKAELWLSCNADSTVSEYKAQSQEAVKTELENAYNGLVKRSYDLNYENLFSFSEWAASGSAAMTRGTLTYDLAKGTLTTTSRAESDKNTAEDDTTNQDTYTNHGNGKDNYYFIPIDSSTKYTFEYTVDNAANHQCYVFFADSNYDALPSPNWFVNHDSATTSGNTKKITFTSPSNAAYVQVRFGSTGAWSHSTTFSNIALYSTARAEEIGLENWTNRQYRKVFDYDDLFPTADHYVPDRPGYTFNKWSVDTNGTGFNATNMELTNFSNVSKIRTSYVLYSNWTANKYNVKFELKGGNGTANNITATYDKEFTLPAALSRTGYTFSGWNTAGDGSGTSYEASAIVKNLTTENGATVTLYAQWLANDCTVKFENDDGTTYATANAKYDGTVTLPETDPTKASDDTNHYVFKGWYKGNTQWTSDTKVQNENLVLTAEYEIVKHTITYTSDDTQHTATCTICGWSKTENHTESSAATCEKAAHCDVCNNDYGNALDHDFSGKIKNESNTQYGEHSYKCTRCYKYGNAKEHVWDKGTPNPEASCTTGGKMKYTCTVEGCDGWYEKNVSATGHDFTKENAEEKYLKSSATCTSQAVYYKSCSVCGESSKGQTGEETFTSGEMSDHSYTVEVEGTRKPATCKATGSVTMKCENCEDATTVTLEIDPNNHVNTAHHAVVPATCIKEGTIEYWSCSDCGKNFSDGACKTQVTNLTISIDKNNHTNTEEKEKQEPNCTDIGYEAGTYCKDCKNWISGHDEIAALGHDFSADDSRIHKLDGDKHNWQCSRCDAYGTGSGANAKVDGSVACDYDKTSAEPIENDETYHKLVCTCGNETTEAHDWEGWEASTDNTDTDKGKMTNTCKDCGYVKTSECNYAEDTEKYLAATCTTPGHRTYVCEDCKHGYSEVLPATGHKFGDVVNAKDADCEKSGNHAYKQCETCEFYFAENAKNDSTDGKEDISSFEIAAKGHDFKEKKAEEKYLKSEATCTEKAVYYKSCSACGESSQGTEKEKTFEYGDALDHDWGEWTAVDGTDTHTRLCKNSCGITETKNHSWGAGDVTKPATCENKGVKTYTCSECSATKTEDINPINHAYDYDKGVLTRPTQKDDGTWVDGYYTYTCKNDSSHTTTKAAKRADYKEYDKALEDLKDLLEKDLTDEAKAEINKVINNQIDQDLIDSEQSKVDEATAKIKETIEKNDSSLKKYKVEFIVNGKTVDTQEIVSGEDATAPNVSGYRDETNHYTFSKWDKGFTNVTEPITVTAVFTSEAHEFTYAQKDIEKHTASCDCGYKTEVEHNYGLTESKAANCTEKGSETYTCSNCNQVKVVEIDALGHETTKTDAKDPTCTESGNWEYWTCSTCKKVFKDQNGNTETTVEAQTLAPLNHSGKVHHEAVKATCIAKGNIEYWSCPACEKNFSDAECTIEVTDVTTEINAKNHFGDKETKKENEVYGTCINEATWDEVTYCKSCGGELDRKPITGLKNSSNHVNTTDEAEEPATCEKPGHSAVKYCNDCKTWLTEVTETPALGHDYKYETFEPTCDKDGVCITTCKRTGCDYHKETVIEASGHDPIKSYVAATCNEYAHTLITCKNCDYTQKIYTGSSYGPHKWVTINEAVDATCTSEGRTACEKCVVCDKQIESEVIAKLPHADENGDGKCDSCGGAYVNNHVCGCICHKDSFIMRIIYAIARFFWRIFKINKTCSCGAVHY